MRRLKEWLKESGIWFKPGDYALVGLDGRVFAGAGGAPPEVAQPVWDGAQDMMSLKRDDRVKCKGLYIVDCMLTLIKPELMLIQKHAPTLWKLIVKEGKLHILFAADNHSRPVFSGKSVKTEIGMLKILLPLLGEAQQASCMSVPFFVGEGVLLPRHACVEMMVYVNVLPVITCEWCILL